MGRTDLDAHVVGRVPLTDHEGKSGAPLERALLRALVWLGWDKVLDAAEQL
jgi:hypothetical protein